MAMSPKAALAKDGTIPVSMGRGRLSKAGIERCTFLAANGWDIEGYVVSSTAPVSPGMSRDVSVTKVKASAEKVIEDFVYTFPENAFKAINTVTRKPVSMREACNNCRVSLVQCHCGNPTYLGDIAVTIMAIK